jgi:DNA-binding SARP family transcriptional activator
MTGGGRSVAQHSDGVPMALAVWVRGDRMVGRFVRPRVSPGRCYRVGQTMLNHYRLEILGRFRLLKRDTSQLVSIRPSCRRLLGLLAVSGAQHRVEAAEALWPGLGERQAQSNLRTVLWRLRQQHSDLVGEDNGYVSLTDIEVDLTGVVDWCRASLGDSLPGTLPPEAIARDVLPGWADSWLVLPREELQVLKVHALEAAGTRALMAGRFGDACNLARIAISLDPLRESASRLLIEVYLREGNPVDAVRHYRLFARRLRDEIGAEPTPGTTALVASYVPDELSVGRRSRMRRD